ncbi:hypothetical protein IFM89_022440 [Coptis chinensis]|uniref:RNase H type-1 domain-containing protein n=1 Tax=Coptis chinensis TaxID=261450 RepID=A0A835I4I0_9MAGN|nr:hypothetical protein IFM89_022440 [Coptis chinensis]
MDNTTQDLATLHALCLSNKLRRAPRCLECYWTAPPLNVLKLNTDGCARGNPGPIGGGVVLRTHTCEVIGTYIGGLDITTSYVAKSKAIVHGIEKAINMGASCIWVESDSTAAVKAFQRDNVHWKVRSQWNRVKHKANTSFSQALGGK